LLSGAGLSTDSGIPDYRGPSGALRARLPMTIAEFRGSPEARHRYWGRAHIGWRRIAAARPNAGHRAVAAMQQAGVLHGIITQNVDGLHQAAGARDVLELHGTLDCVVCLECGARSTREALDQRLRTANPNLGSDEVPASNPDGDAELADEQVARFRVVGCECCGADLLKPDVVFFGENVPRAPGAAVLRSARRLGLSARARVLAHSDVRAALRAPGSAGADPGGDRQPGRDPWRLARRHQSRRRAG
jgi:NAD-dependent SIR2 family protein deacetylase